MNCGLVVKEIVRSIKLVKVLDVDKDLWCYDCRVIKFDIVVVIRGCFIFNLFLMFIVF